MYPPQNVRFPPDRPYSVVAPCRRLFPRAVLACVRRFPLVFFFLINSMRFQQSTRKIILYKYYRVFSFPGGRRSRWSTADLHIRKPRNIITVPCRAFNINRHKQPARARKTQDRPFAHEYVLGDSPGLVLSHSRGYKIPNDVLWTVNK